jgi:hypothetical protein
MYGLNLLCHMRAMSEALKELGANANVNFATLALEITHGGKYFELTPQFAKLTGNTLEYEPALSAEVAYFPGWRLDSPEDCQIKRDKLAFKRFCAAHDLRTPALVDPQSSFDGWVLVKERTLGDFRGLIYGPMPLAEAQRGGFRSAGRNFLEEFIDGNPLQVWYWGGKLACVENHKKAVIVGNGVSTVRELAQCLCPPARTADWQIIEALARCQGEGMEAVLERGRELAVDFRFETPLHVTNMNQNIVHKLAGTRVLQQLEHAGPIFAAGVSPANSERALFRLDAVLDRQERVWFTSFDPDRYVHPDIYPVMVRELFMTAGQAAILEQLKEPVETRH